MRGGVTPWTNPQATCRNHLHSPSYMYRLLYLSAQLTQWHFFFVFNVCGNQSVFSIQLLHRHYTVSQRCITFPSVAMILPFICTFKKTFLTWIDVSSLLNLTANLHWSGWRKRTHRPMWEKKNVRSSCVAEASWSATVIHSWSRGL